MNTYEASKKILVTGGAGFVGSHIVEALSRNSAADIVVLDAMTYAAHESHLDLKRVRLVEGNILDLDLVKGLAEGADLIVHAAAETHVDRSFLDPLAFTRTNVLGTHSVMEAALAARVPRVVHVSTDEVYGEVLEGHAGENCRHAPTSPYAASKAAAEVIVDSYFHSYGLPVVTVRANNAYGTRQFPEKLLPRAIWSLMNGETIPLHGDGRSVRHYLAATDFADAVVLLARCGKAGEAYNLGANVSYENREVARLVCEAFGRDFEESVTFVRDRPFNDRRYAVSFDKIAALGWFPTRSLADDVPAVVEWYRENESVIRSRVDQDRSNFLGTRKHDAFSVFMSDISAASLHI